MQYGFVFYRHFCPDELQISLPLFFAFKIHLVTCTISGNFDSEKIYEDKTFYAKIYYISCRNDPNITHTKSRIRG
jgi:hypothetical protein